MIERIALVVMIGVAVAAFLLWGLRVPKNRADSRVGHGHAWRPPIDDHDK